MEEYKSLPAREEWIEIDRGRDPGPGYKSLPAREEWIEI